MHHAHFMDRCLKLAGDGRIGVGNGALVGAVLVRGGRIIAEEFHSTFGEAHAERKLLDKFEQKMYSNDVLYVNLEPCCHHGKTPPCTDRILASGLKHVVFGMRDPDRRVSGKGIAELRNAGIEVIGPILEPQCRRMNRGFVSLRCHARPFITLKRAIAPDGNIAAPDGSPRKITSVSQDTWAHTFLRATHDAILVGCQTVMRDNPVLDTRLDSFRRQLHPWRIILDPRLRTPLDARVVNDAFADRTIMIHGAILNHAMDAAASELSIRGVLLREVGLQDSGVFDWQELWDALTLPRDSFHGITSILVEGGQQTWETFRCARMVDEEVTLMGSDVPS